MVILESTTYPGTTEERVGPRLTEATGLTAPEDYHLVFSPERIDPGNPIYSLENTPRVVGGLGAAAGDAAAAFYSSFIDQRAPGVRPARGRDGQAAGEHLPAREHRAGQRDGDLLRGARHRPVGVDRRRVDQAVRVRAVHARAPASAATASRSTRRTSPGACAGSATRSASSSSPREINDRMPVYVASRVAALLNDVAQGRSPARGSWSSASPTSATSATCASRPRPS